MKTKNNSQKDVCRQYTVTVYYIMQNSKIYRGAASST